jgi:hypothetical protein
LGAEEGATASAAAKLTKEGRREEKARRRRDEENYKRGEGERAGQARRALPVPWGGRGPWPGGVGGGRGVCGLVRVW